MRRDNKYFSDKPCLRGHIGLHFKISKACVECSRIKGRQRLESETPEQREKRLAKARENGRKWHERVKDIRNAKIRDKYAEEKEKYSVRAAKRYLRTREQVLLQSAEYYRKNKEKISLRTRARGAKLRALGEVERSYIEFLHQAQRGKCAACAKKLVKFHLDHKLAIANGGTNERHNLQLLCPTCNLRKATKSMEDFMRRLGKLL